MVAAGKYVGAAEVALPTSLIRKFSVRSNFAFLELNTFAIESPFSFYNLTAVTITLVCFIVSLNLAVPAYLIIKLNYLLL